MTYSNGQHPTVDFDLHGLVGIRLIGATQREVNAVGRQLGPIQRPLNRDPDITIRFVDRLTTSSPLRYLGVDDAAFTDDAFLVLRSKHKARAKVQIPFEQIGGPCEIVCERGLPAVPLLIPIINLTVLSKGALPLHAAAFNYKGVGVLATGWSKGGKTETLLSFTSHGAEYVGDEWIYLTADGSTMYGIPEPLHIWDWHFEHLPHYWKLTKPSERLRIRAVQLLARVAERVLPAKIRPRVLPLIKGQLFVHMPPQRLFGQRITPMTGRPELLIFVASHETPDITIKPIDPQELAQRMVFSLQEERMPFMSYYWKFRFAFPERSNAFIEGCEALEREVLSRVFANKQTYAVYHPYPFAIPRLFDTISPLLNEAVDTTASHR